MSEFTISLIVVSIIHGKSSDPQPPPILRLSRLSRLCKLENDLRWAFKDEPDAEEKAMKVVKKIIESMHYKHPRPGQRWRQTRGS